MVKSEPHCAHWNVRPLASFIPSFQWLPLLAQPEQSNRCPQASIAPSKTKRFRTAG